MERTKTGEFNWVDLSAKDMTAQAAFYQALFGWTFEDVPFGEGQTYRMFKKDGHSVAGMSQLSPEMLAGGMPTMWNTYLATDDVDAMVANAVGLGATVAMPPADVAESGRIAAIMDPTGGLVFFWKPRRTDESIVYLKPGVLSWNDLATREPEKAADFYAKLLGWDVQPQGNGVMPYWQINIDGVGEGGIMPMPDMIPPEIPAFWTVYFGSVDVRADTAKAVELGATVQAEPIQVNDMVIYSVMADPAGAVFALVGEPAAAAE